MTSPNATVSLVYFFASLILPDAQKNPVNAEAAKLHPRGIINMNPTKLTMMTSAASASTLMSPAKIAKISKIHHSKLYIIAAGKPSSR
jgi:hypothetical protein